MSNPRKDIFNKMAEDWDKLKMLSEEHLNTISQVIEGLNIGKSDHILDVGCGTGVLIPYFVKYLGDGGKVLGVDVSDKMIEIAKNKYHDDRLTFIDCDIYDYEFLEDSFDHVVIFSVFPHLHKKKLALDIFYQCLKRGGKLTILHVEGSSLVNKFHADKKNPTIQNDYLPRIDEMMDIIETKKWDILVSEDKDSRYLLKLGKK